MNKIKHLKEEILSNGCPKEKCFLSIIYPNSNANLACDFECYFKKGEPGEKDLEKVIKEYPEKFENFN